jgi:hypothetical protein
MASLDTRLVYKELKKIAGASQAIKHKLRQILEQIETDPSSFRELEVPRDIAKLAHLVAIRVANLTSHKHDFRIVFAHWRFADDSEHADLLMAFPRKEGYQIDWDWVREVTE